MRKFLPLLVALVVGFAALNVRAITCSRTDIQCNTVGSSAKYQVTSAGNVSMAGSASTDADVRLGTSGTAETVSTTSGNSQGLKVPVQIAAASSSVLEGSVLVVTAPISSSGNVLVSLGGATTDLTTVAGVAAGAGSAGDVIDMYTTGFILARTTGTVNPGDVLVTTTSAAGYLTGDSTPTTGADVGVALSTGTSGGGLTKILLIK